MAFTRKKGMNSIMYLSYCIGLFWLYGLLSNINSIFSAFLISSAEGLLHTVAVLGEVGILSRSRPIFTGGRLMKPRLQTVSKEAEQG